MNIYYDNVFMIASRDAVGGVANLCACDPHAPL